MKRKRISGKYCVAGGPGMVSCENTSQTPNISMHKFPNNAPIRNKWTKFVQKHRPTFVPSSASVLCSVHFEPYCFTRRFQYFNPMDGEEEVQLPPSKRVRLQEEAVPTIDCASTITVVNSSDRERRSILRDVLKPCSGSEVLSEQLEIKSTVTTNMPSNVNTTSQPKPSAADVHLNDDQPGNEVEDALKPTCCELKKKLRKLQKRNSYWKRKYLTCSQRNLKSDQSSSGSSTSSECESEEDDLEQGYTSVIYSDEESTVHIEYNSDVSANKDSDWAPTEEEEQTETSENSDTSVKVDNAAQEEPKFLVFYTMLVQLFTMFCFRCKSGKPTVEMKKNGTSVTVEQYCEDCGGPPFTWRSQPLLLGKYPAGNILLSFAILLSGASISKIYLVFKHMGVSIYNMRTFFIHQKKLPFPVILYYWEKYRSSLVQSLKGKQNVAWCGDGRYNSVGHSAKYGAFTMFCSDVAKIVHFELLQVLET